MALHMHEKTRLGVNYILLTLNRLSIYPVLLEIRVTGLRRFYRVIAQMTCFFKPIITNFNTYQVNPQKKTAQKGA